MDKWTDRRRMDGRMHACMRACVRACMYVTMYVCIYIYMYMYDLVQVLLLRNCPKVADLNPLAACVQLTVRFL